MIIEQCANWHSTVNGCIMEVVGSHAEGECAVRDGKRCAYFERAVLPLAGRLAQYAEIPALYYEKQTDGKLGVLIEQNHCGDCGQVIPGRRRVCDKCRVKRRRASYRELKRKLQVGNSTVSES